LDHPENIAAGGLSGDPGDNENALQIAAVQMNESLSIQKWTISDRGATPSSSVETTAMDDYYRTLVGEIGITTEAANENQSFVQSMVDNLQDLRDSVSGVNLDEEMTEVLKLQRSYEANSKIIGIADQMLQSLMELV
jgi:flagellar hook-associated protein 1 FlgK